VTSSEHTEPAGGEPTGRLQVSVGNEAFEPGLTEVVLQPSGEVRVTSRLEGSDDRRAELKLEPERASELIRSADRSVQRAREGKRYGLPDEPRYHFEIGEGERRQSFDVWRSELADRPELQRIVSTLQGLVDEQVDGEILL
jgi:hypothetical protein